ncbi:MAG: hypothetical protein IPO24_19130 [Bacteroidetes bacterium]|nr:hypothetical protein [Bacteroidota bacterium]
MFNRNSKWHIRFFGIRYWNIFGAPGTGVDDVAFLSALIDSLDAEYNIDLNRVYSTGMSNGGFMSHALACELSNRIAAIASVTGSIDKDRMPFCDPQHNTPVMQIHGTADETVPYDGNFEFLPVDSVVSYWVKQNHCDATPEFTEVRILLPSIYVLLNIMFTVVAIKTHMWNYLKL